MASENGPGPGGSAAKRVSPDRGFYTDPGTDTPAGLGDAGSGPPMTASDIGAPAWTPSMLLPPEVPGGFPLPADITGAEPSPRRRRLVPLTAAAITLVAALAVTAVVLGNTSAHKPAATHAPTPTAARKPVVRELTIGQLRAGDCLQGPPDVNTANPWPDVVTAVPCPAKHLAEVYFFSANYWPAKMAFPGNTKIAHKVKSECHKAFRAYDGIPYSGSRYSYSYLSPWGRVDWDSGDRLMACTAYLWTGAYPRGEVMYGSIKGSYG